MGCICSKGASEKDVAEEYEKGNELTKATSVQLVAPPSQKREKFLVEVNGDCSVRPLSRATSRANASQTSGSIHRKPKEDDNRVVVVEGPSIDHHQRLATMELSSSKSEPQMTRIVSVVNGNSNGSGGRDPNEEAGWPSWLTSVAGDAIKGWAPRKAESFAKLDKEHTAEERKETGKKIKEADRDKVNNMVSRVLFFLNINLIKYIYIYNA
ncbi:probable serine/threonine-protein kinase At1g09600 [Humulus lupulus]|uniref:probable serine/threonine-protein kinase At1g09600 n=1 Tax=Humulus lupulus TaxID=3486 RepID=UPI002B406C51|nr:probable serine/threonine-protein kinase At1g09600 [Humulus lupulus]